MCLTFFSLVRHASQLARHVSHLFQLGETCVSPFSAWWDTCLSWRDMCLTFFSLVRHVSHLFQFLAQTLTNCPALHTKGNFWKFMLQTCSTLASRLYWRHIWTASHNCMKRMRLSCLMHVFVRCFLITFSAIFLLNKWYDTYRDTYRVSDQCIDDTYRIIDTIHKTGTYDTLR